MDQVKTYQVTLTRDTTESISLNIKAKSVADAERVALERVGDFENFDLKDWEQDDTIFGGDPYIGDPGSAWETDEEPDFTQEDPE